MKRRNKMIAVLVLVCLLIGMLPLQSFAATKDTSKIFEDIAPGAWYKKAVDYVYDLGLFSGTSKTTFEPNANVNRAMFVTVLARMEGVKVNNKVTTKFTDVPKGQWYTGSVKWASDNGIVNGATATTFAPSTAISREQMCAMILRYANYRKITLKKSIKKATFEDDGAISSYAKSAVYACQRAGIVNGVTATRFDPAATATRAQAAKILMIFHQDYVAVKAEGTPPADDPADEPVTPPADDPADEPVTPPAEEDNKLKELLENKTKLRFNEDGDFKVMVLADLHAKDTGLSAVQQSYIKTMVDREQPDLVILTGDNVRSLPNWPIKDADHLRRVLDTCVGYLEEKGIYWMHVYGNHDQEDFVLDKEAQQAIYEEYEYCISKDVAELTGVGNYVVPLYGSDESCDEIKFAFWALDSGSNMSEEDKKLLFPNGQSAYGDHKSLQYDYIHYDQIKWYENTSEQLEAYAGAKVPGLMAFHMPLQEYYTAWLNRYGTEWTGAKNETIASSAYNSGLYEVMRYRGDIKATVVGHDHKNTFMVNYGGIKLCYSPTISTNSYYDEKEMGCRVFTLKEEDPSDVDTYVSYVQERIDNGEVQPIEDGYTYDFEGEAPHITATGNSGYATSGAYLDKIETSVQDGIGRNGSKGLAAKRTYWAEDGLGSNSIQLIWDIPVGKVGDNKYLAVWVDFAKDNAKLRKGCFGVIVDGDYAAHYETDANDTVTDFYMKGETDAKWTTVQTDSDGCMVGLQGFKGWLAVPLDGMRQKGTGASLTSESVVTGLLVFIAPYYAENINKDYIYDDFTFVEDYKSVSPETEEPDTANTVLVTDFEGTSLTVADITATGNAGSKTAKLENIGLAIKEGVGRNGSKGLAVQRTAWDSSNIGNNSIQLIWDIEPMKKGDNEYLAVWVDFAKNDAELRIGCFGVIVDDNYTNHYETDAYDKVCEFYTKADGATEWTTMETNKDGCMVSMKGFKGWIAVPLSSMEKFKNQEQFLTADSNITGILVFNAPNYEAQVGKEFYYDDFTFCKDYNDIV